MRHRPRLSTRRPDLLGRLLGAAFLSALLGSLAAGPLSARSIFQHKDLIPPDCAAEFLPRDLLFYAEAEGLGAWAEGIPQSALLDRITGLSVYADYKNSPQYSQFLAGLGFVQMVTGDTAARAVGDLLGEEISVGVLPDESGKQPVLIAAIKTKNAETAVKMVDAIERLSRANPEAKIVEGHHRGIRGVSINGKLHIAAADRFLVIASDGRMLKSAFDRVLDKKPSFVDNPLYAAAADPAQSGAMIHAVLDTGRLANSYGIGRLVPEKLKEAAASLFFGDLMEATARAEFVRAVLSADGDQLDLAVEIPVAPDTLPAQFRAFEHQRAQAEPLRVVDVQGGMATICARRDIASWWQDRGELLEESTEKGFAEFETGLGVFFAGRSIGDQILPALKDDILIVGSRQTFEGHSSPPKAKFPAGAAVLHFKDADRWSQELAVAFHSLIGVINVERGQSGHTPLLNYTENYKDTVIYGSRFLDNDDRPFDIGRYNFSPALARVGDRVVLSTSDELLRQVVDALKSDNLRSLPLGTLTYLELTGADSRRILEDNREALVAQSMVNEGKSLEDATREMGIFIEIAGQFERLTLSSSVDPRGFAVRLQSRLTPVEPRLDTTPTATALEGDGR